MIKKRKAETRFQVTAEAKHFIKHEGHQVFESKKMMTSLKKSHNISNTHNTDEEFYIYAKKNATHFWKECQLY